ncbi:MAG: hypothetical protein AMS16_04485 [Planctomycetes bacterium DG_58]|nr:MAG: hypothetical protein AMS16_04485 [Planctomycetes bacterium DG_58]
MAERKRHTAAVALLLLAIPALFTGCRRQDANEQESRSAEAKRDLTWDRWYYPSGTLKHVAPMIDGKENGLIKDYYETGELEWETPAVDGAPNGVKKRYAKDGTLLRELSFVHGRLTGPTRYYFEDGTLRKELNLVNGDLHGVRRAYDQKGNLLTSEDWKHGTGVRRDYDRHGRLLSEQAYRDGYKHGLMKEYDGKGNVSRRWWYVDGWRRTKEAYEAFERGEDLAAGHPVKPDPAKAAPRTLATPKTRRIDSPYVREFEAKRKAARDRILERGRCNSPHEALVLLKHRTALDEVNAFLSGKVRPLKPRSLDVQIYYQILALAENGLTDEARKYVASLCDKHYNAKLPTWVSLERPYDPWNYLFCGTPTENHLLNDTSNRLAESVVFPGRVFSDGHTAAEYRAYWKDAFRQFVASRVRYGMREWRSSIYCHVVFDDAMMIYNLMPEGPTREAARVFLDYLFLSIASSLRGPMWTGPHSRVYNNRGHMLKPTRLNYIGYARQLLGEGFLAPIIVSDYVIPEAIAKLPFRKDRYVSIEKVGPKYHPPGLGKDVFNPDRRNFYICRADREDWGGDGIVYNYLTPRYGLGSVQDWGKYDGEWHMHCVPWSLMIATGEGTDMVLSFTGSEAESTQQGGYMTWANHDTDQDGTIFQHRKTLLCQLRGWHQDRQEEFMKTGPAEAPWAPAPRFRRVCPIGDKRTFHSRFYVAHSLGEPVIQKGWVFGEKAGVCFAVRPVRGGFREEKQNTWIPGRVYLCEVWDDVVLLEVAETEDFGSFENFREKVLALPLEFDDREVRLTNLDGDRIRFRWKEDGEPTVNGKVPEYGGMRFSDPCIKSEYDSGVVEVNCDGARVTLHAESPDSIHREEW